jgi:hypothetical protein
MRSLATMIEAANAALLVDGNLDAISEFLTRATSPTSPTRT